MMRASYTRHEAASTGGSPTPVAWLARWLHRGDIAALHDLIAWGIVDRLIAALASAGDDDEDALALAWLALIQAHAAGDRRTVRRIQIYMRRLGWDCVPRRRQGGRR